MTVPYDYGDFNYKSSVHFGARQVVNSYPFTAPTDGVIIINSNPKTASESYDYFSVNNDISKGCVLSNTTGRSMIGMLVVLRGDVVRNPQTLNVGSRAAVFIPLLGG